MTTVPSSAAMIEPSERPAASGIRARIVAIAVIRIGRTRVRPPSIRASFVEWPSTAQPLDEVEQDDRVGDHDPDEHQEPDEGADADRLAGQVERREGADRASGRLNRMMNGVTSELKVSTIIT